MPPKQKTPAPIDRPLSRAYLREFSGWSTAYPPGLSEPTSLRVMENVIIGRDGSARVRPGLKYLSYQTYPSGSARGTVLAEKCVGTHEVFYLADGSKAYLFAVRESDGTVGFRALSFNQDDSTSVLPLDDPRIGFTIPQGEPALRFTEATTYVKYLQIDNTIFALSDAGETLRVFHVGANKIARRPYGITRPGWSAGERLTVVHPDAAWINSGVPVKTRTNLILNPSFEAGTTDVVARYGTETARVTSTKTVGSYSLRMTSTHARKNYMPRPLHDVPTYGDAGWFPIGYSDRLVAEFSYLRLYSQTGQKDKGFQVDSVKFPVDGGKTYKAAWDVVGVGGVDKSEIVVRWYDKSGSLISTYVTGAPVTVARQVRDSLVAPAAATHAVFSLRPYTNRTTECSFSFKNVVFVRSGESSAIFSGDSGTDYYWTGTVGNSASVYHPPAPADVSVRTASVGASADYAMRVRARSGTSGGARTPWVGLYFYDSSGNITGTRAITTSADSTSWVTYTGVVTAPAKSVRAELRVRYEDVPRGEYHYIDELLVESGSTVGAYFDGSTASTSTFKRSWDGDPHVSTSKEVEYSIGGTIPAAETPTAATLVSSDTAANTYNFGYFYTISNELGESAASFVTQLRVQRAESGWRWETANSTGEPSGTATSVPEKAADQLIAYMPESVYNMAKNQGATHWSVYRLTWTDQEPVPVEGTLLGTKEFTESGTYGEEGWMRHSVAGPSGDWAAILPNRANRFNYSDPPRAGQGLVASDRMVLVYDRSDPALIRWTAGRMGDYTNFTAHLGGGYKTLTSGNLYIPSVVKLWQNPESKDTITILTRGTDGYSNAYYMAPAEVGAQSDAVKVMSFEETTATPGTTSPYGCEIVNNALYHPLEDQLMKSTASNYNINHKSMTELIENMWRKVRHKARIVSSELDNRIYYLVYNPEGDPLVDGAQGNEIWVLDVAVDTPTWARWRVQGCALRKIEVHGRAVMSVVKPDGIYYFDENVTTDVFVNSSGEVEEGWGIPWKLETNTQGANRAHDAWARLQQVSVTLGNFTGWIRYGVRGQDVNGMPVEAVKEVRDDNDLPADGLPFDLEDHLQVSRDMKEWRFFAETVKNGYGIDRKSSGQISLVQYRYAPISVNVGYEYGSVETFEYSRNTLSGNDAYSTAGVPNPYIDTGRP